MDYSTQTNITQTKFYSPALNAAIFDGPIKIYFSQAQENTALKLYFELNKKMQGMDFSENETSHPQIYVILYPSSENFYNSFDKSLSSEESHKALIGYDQWEDYHVIGIRGPIENECLGDVYDTLSTILAS